MRLKTNGGGCREVEYEMIIVDAKDVDDHDKVIQLNGINIYVDPISFLRLDCMTLSFDDFLDAGFKFMRSKN